MNLAKKGTMLLAAASAFAITSCGNKAISYDEARKWIKEHYTEEKSRTVNTSTCAWDYSKNDSQGKKTPADLPLIGDRDVNYFIQGILKNFFEVDDEEKIKNKKDSALVAGCPYTPADSTLTVSDFDNFVFSNPISLKVYKENSGLKLDFYDKREEELISGSGIKVSVKQSSKLYYDKEGFLSKATYVFYAKPFLLSITSGENESVTNYYDLGILNATVTLTPKDIA